MGYRHPISVSDRHIVVDFVVSATLQMILTSLNIVSGMGVMKGRGRERNVERGREK